MILNCNDYLCKNVFFMQKAKILLVFMTFGIFSLFSSCVDEEPNIIPDVYVDIYVNLSLPQFFMLNSINNAVKIPNEGYDKNGVIVYRLGLEEYLAFDATCPQHVQVSTSVNLDNNGTEGSATCPHCSTTYSFPYYGQASKRYPLKSYKVSVG